LPRTARCSCRSAAPAETPSSLAQVLTRKLARTSARHVGPL